MILLLDNYDSFAHNLARYVRQLGCVVQVVRNDKITIAEINKLAPEKIIISPGPKDPDGAGVALDIVREFGARIPILGICLGHQVIAAAYGAKVIRSAQPAHGKASTIHCLSSPIFQNMPQNFNVGRYHSLIVQADGLPKCLRVIAKTSANEIMALEHDTHPVLGLQFHPESVLTEHGYAMLNNFLGLAVA
jgi:anthranilate synthase component II